MLTRKRGLRDSLNKAKTRVLIDMTSVIEISKEARDYFANERTASIQRATALLIGSPVSRVIGNFFMGLNKPISPNQIVYGSAQSDSVVAYVWR